MPLLSSERRAADSKRGTSLQQSDTGTTEMLSAATDLFSPTLEMHMESGVNFDFQDNELGPSLLNGGSSIVYSPFFMQMAYPEKTTTDSNKPFVSSYDINKNTSGISSEKNEPPMIRLPECAAKTNNTSFTHLATYLSENTSYLAECIDQLQHVSCCQQMDNDCSYLLCVNLKQDIFHACTCIEEGCQRCHFVRPLILLHSMTCQDEQCQISLCPRYRIAWNQFQHSLSGVPIPRIDLLFTRKIEIKSPIKVETILPIDNTKKLHTRLSKSSSSLCAISLDSPHSDLSDIPLKSPSASFPSTTLPTDDEIPEKQLSLTPLSSYAVPNQSLSDPPSPLSPTIQNSIKSSIETKISSTQTAQYIVCIKCNKRRAVPSTIDLNLLPVFDCIMNIWDDNKYNQCSNEENVDVNYIINLAKKGPNYEQECTHFINKLKQFYVVNQNVSYRPPTLGRKEVDLYRLFREVTAHGGCESVVSKEGTWAKIYRGLDNFSPTETSASFRLKKMYTKYLLAYEKYVFGFLPIPQKKHRYTQPSVSIIPNGTQPILQNATIPTVSGGIQNSAIFPQTYSYQSEEVNTKRGKGVFSLSEGYGSSSNYMPIHQLGHQLGHQSTLLTSSTKYKPGAGIGLAGGTCNWQQSRTAPVTRAASSRRGGSSSPVPGSINQNDHEYKDDESRNDFEIGGHRLRGSISPTFGAQVNRNRMNEISSPLSSSYASSMMLTRNQTKREQCEISKSPLITGEDQQGAAGLQALLTLRSSLSPTLQASDMRWDALMTAATDDLRIERNRMSPMLEALPKQLMNNIRESMV